MDGARNQLLAGAGFAQDQDRRVRRRHDLCLLEDASQRVAFADDFAEWMLAADFALEVEAFLGELVLERGDLSNASALATAIATCPATASITATAAGVNPSGRRLPTLSVPSA
jgi:hypothetical protein